MAEDPLNPAAVARGLMALHRRADELKREVIALEVAGGYAARGPGEETEFPSTNPNRVQFVGCGRPTTEDEVTGVVESYHDAERWFFWLSPCDQADEIREWLTEAGLVRFGGAGYPVLARTVEALPEHETDLTVRQASRADTERHSDRIREVYEGSVSIWTSALDDPDHRHYLAFDGQEPVACAMMHVVDRVAGLGMMVTLESHRRRGAQNALIVQRVNDADALGCDLAVSETLSFLTTSIGNLRRQGFEVVYQKEVYVGGTRPPPDYDEWMRE